jgi:hypothetical protein
LSGITQKKKVCVRHTKKNMTVVHAEGKTFHEDRLSVYGNNNTVSGSRCNVIGDKNTVTGTFSNVTGDNNVVRGSFCTVEGRNNDVRGSFCTVEGRSNDVRGSFCKARGTDNYCAGTGSKTMGSGDSAPPSLVDNLVGLAANPTTVNISLGSVTGTHAQAVSTGTTVATYSDDIPPPPPRRRGGGLRIGGSVGAIGVGARGFVVSQRDRRSTAAALGVSSAGVSKTPRASRLSRTSLYLQGPAVNKIVRSSSGTRTTLNGVELPPGTSIGSQISTSSGTIIDGIDSAIADQIIEKYGDDTEQQQQQQQRKTLKQVLETLEGKDRPEEDDDKQCIVCCEQKKCVALIPCGHTETCVKCALELVKDGGVNLTCTVCSGETKTVAFVRI